MKASREKSKIRGWAVLILCLAMFWGFGVFLGPWMAENIPVMRDVVTVIEEQDINSSAYFYTEIEASYEGERYLRESCCCRSSASHVGRGGSSPPRSPSQP